MGSLLIGGAGIGNSGTAWAQQAGTPNQAELDAAIREGGRPERVIPTPGTILSKPIKKDGPRTLEAQKIEGISQQSASAEGGVVLKQSNMEVRTERLDYDQVNDTATTVGKVTMLRDSDIFDGYDLKLKLDTEVGTLLNPTFLFGKTPLRPTQRYEARGSAVRRCCQGGLSCDLKIHHTTLMQKSRCREIDCGCAQREVAEML